MKFSRFFDVFFKMRYKMRLTPMKNRYEMLLKNGAPKKFLDSIGEVEELECLVENPNKAYSYIPKISNYKIISNFEVTPIYGCEETFVVLLSKNENSKIIKFELESDEIYKDYGLNWDLLLLEIMIDYFDFTIDDEISIAEFESVGNKIGFKHSKELYELRNLDTKEYNDRLDDDEAWREEIAQKLKIL